MCDFPPPGPPKVAVVTGANKGIGFGIVKALCSQFDGEVYLTARDVERGEAAVAELEKLGLHPKFHQLDIDSSESIHKFRDFLKTKYGGIDVLVNNAAIAYKHNATEPFGEQAENTIRVNFTAFLNVSHNLMQLLRQGGRVVNISSSVGHLSKIPSKEIRDKLANPNIFEHEIKELMEDFVKAAKEGNHEAAGWPNSAYAVSKVGVSAATKFQQRMMDVRFPAGDGDILVNAVHPGYVDTDMTSHKGPLTIEQGSIAAVWAALIPPGVKSPKGGYIWYDTQVVDWVNGPLPSAY